MRRLSALHLCLILLAYEVRTAEADAWDDFANNLATDLAPILALFGEQVAKQFLSESTTMWDNFIFAMAPLGVITAVVSAIRVCGGPSLRAFIGRAQEGGGIAEAELCSSTSRDVCEMYHNGAIVRVFGRPKILEIIHDHEEARKEFSSGNDLSPSKCGIFSFREYITTRAPKESECREDGKPFSDDIEAPQQSTSARITLGSEDDEDSIKFAPNPNLSFNIGIRRPSKYAPWLAAAATFLAQASVLVLGGLVTSWGWKKEEEVPPAWAFPLMSLGIVLLCRGMFFCAFLVENSTKERVFHRKNCDEGTENGRSNLPKSSIYVVQPGNQTIGDQTFDSFLFDDSTNPINQYITSWKTQHSSDELRVWLATAMTVSGFVLQFVGLRAMHSVVSVLQLGVILFASIIRASLRTQRLRREDNLLHDRPDEVEGHELDFLALHIAKDGKDQGNLSWVVVGPSAVRHSANTTEHSRGDDDNTGNNGLAKKTPGDDSQKKSQSIKNIARTFYYRSRLAELTSQSSIVKSRSSTTWGDGQVPVRQLAEQLRKAIQSSVKILYPTGSSVDDETVSWTLHMAQAQYNHALPWSGVENVSLQIPLRKREDLPSTWNTIQRHLEAAIGLWTWSVISDPRMKKPNNNRFNSKASKASEVPISRIMAIGATQDVLEGAKVEMQFWTNDFPLVMQRELVFGEDPRILGPDVLWNTEENGTIHSISTATDSLIGQPSQSLLRFFGWQFGKSPKPNGFLLTTGVNHSIPSACAQDLYQHFLCEAVTKVGAIGGQTKSSKGSSRFCVQNEVVSGLLECFKESGLGSAQDAFSVIFPVLRDRSKLPPATEALPNAYIEAENLRENGKFQEAEDILRWAWETIRTLRDEQMAAALEEVMLELGELYRHAFFWEQGSQQVFAAKGISWMEDQAVKMLSKSPSFKSLSGISNRYLQFKDRAVDMSRPVKAEDVLVSVSEGNRAETLWLINQVTEFVCQDDDGRTVLSWAAQQGWPEVVKAAIHIGSAIDSEDKGGRTPLSYAAEHGRVHVAQILMKSRALPTLFDGNRQTPLLHAAAGGHVAVVRTLFDDPRVSPLDTDKNGYTALHCAAEKGHKDAIELLLEKRAKIDAVNEKGQTPLIVSLLKHQKSAADFLVKQKANHKVKINNLEAWDWAFREGEWACVEFLLQLANAEDQKSGTNVATRRAFMLKLFPEKSSPSTDPHDFIPVSQPAVTVYIFDESGRHVPITVDSVKLAAKGCFSAEAFLYEKREWSKVQFFPKKVTVKIAGLLLDRLEKEVKVSEDVVKAAAENTKDGIEMMNLLLDRRGDELKMTEDIIKAAARNGEHGKELMKLLLDRLGDEVKITEDIVKAAAANGKEITKLLLDRRGNEVKITEAVVIAATERFRVMELLFERRNEETKVTEEVVKAAARNGGTGHRVMELLFNQRNEEVKVTREVVEAALENMDRGDQVLKVLLKHRSKEGIVTEEDVKAAAEKQRLMRQRIMEKAYMLISQNM